MKRITLCADDYGITSGVSQAILTLADRGAIHATSCMVTMPAWQEHAIKLIPYIDTIDIGLHLNLTEGKGLTQGFQQSFPSLYSLLIKSHLRLLPYTQLVEEIRAQIQAFITTTGGVPDFIDGHQHVHHLPQVRQALISSMLAMKLPPSTWVRSVSPLVAPDKNLKCRVIEHSGARQLHDLSTQAKYRTNTAFAGVYSLSQDEAFRPLMQSWLRELPDASLIMCHPCLANTPEAVDHAQARYIEYDYLASDTFRQDCHSAGIKLQRLFEAS
ncbi:ChbG/HpnK family deacetylase [Endozoicomonas sp.]|nr:ChbG/HpnK family deacetylase [Endozoicomonas sp.]